MLVRWSKTIWGQPAGFTIYSYVFGRQKTGCSRVFGSLILDIPGYLVSKSPLGLNLPKRLEWNSFPSSLVEDLLFLFFLSNYVEPIQNLCSETNSNSRIANWTYSPRFLGHRQPFLSFWHNFLTKTPDTIGPWLIPRIFKSLTWILFPVFWVPKLDPVPIVLWGKWG